DAVAPQRPPSPRPHVLLAPPEFAAGTSSEALGEEEMVLSLSQGSSRSEHSKARHRASRGLRWIALDAKNLAHELTERTDRESLEHPFVAYSET
ncbi:unnamed protein product, partial [Durusdinium trenchii]